MFKPLKFISLCALAVLVCIAAQVSLAKESPDSKYASPTEQSTTSSRTPSALDEILLTESFVSPTFPPAGWTQDIQNTNDPTYTWYRDAVSFQDAPGAAGCLYDPALSPQDEWLISPVIDLSGETDPIQVRFWWMMSYFWGVSPNDNYDIELRYSTDGGANWNPTVLWDESEQGTFDNYVWYEITVDLSTFAGQANFKLAWRYVGSDGAQGGVDNITVETLGATGNLNGFVTNAETTLPIENATVVVEGTAYSATTDATGMYSFVNISTGTYDITASHPLYDSETNEGVEVTDGGLTASDFALSPTPYTYATTGAPVPIVDMQTSTMTLNIPDDVLIEDMDITMHITHTYTSDLTITFDSPDNTTVALATEVGGNGHNFVDTRFDDEAATPIANGAAPFTGSFQPEGNLSDYDGFSAQGTWTLSVTDNYAQDVGTIDYFYIHIQTTTAIGDEPSLMPEAFALHQNYPNPFNPSTALKFDVPQSGYVTLAVYNVLGEEVARLADGIMEAGSHVVYFNAVAMPSGLYFARMTAPGFDATRKLVLMK